MILAGDVGGTKTQLALFEPGARARAPAHSAKLASHGHASLAALVREFVDPLGARPARAVFGIAGPVVGGRCEATNLPWIVSEPEMSAALDGAKVTLMNDLEATAWGLEQLDASDLVTLQPGEPHAGNRALIAAGTGLGEALLVWNGSRWRPSASEGGHADFGARDPLEDELLLWLRAAHGRVSYERILSGRGLADLYRFLTATARGAEPPAFASRFAAAEDPAALVTEAALDGSCGRARLAVERWVDIYGAEAGNLALKALAVAGLFVGGGIAPRLIDVMRDGRFARAFGAKGRLAPMLREIPIAVIRDERTALWGAAAVGLAA